jgi:hypothetical protein
MHEQYKKLSDQKRKRDASIGSNNPLSNLTKPNLNFKNLKREEELISETFANLKNKKDHHIKIKL